MFTNINELEIVISAISSEMDTLTKVVHENALDYLRTNGSKIEQILSHILSGIDVEVLDKSLVGKLRNKLPQIKLGAGYNSFQLEKSKLVMSALIVQHLIDTKHFNIREDLDVSTVDGKKIFSKKRYILTQTLSNKNLLKGLTIGKPGKVNGSVHTKVGGPQVKLSSSQKKFRKRIDSQGFILSDVANKELLDFAYSISSTMLNIADPMTKTQEDYICAKHRYDRYGDGIMSLRGKVFYFTTWLGSRTRMYYDFQLEGFRPQGKPWEVLLIDSEHPYYINKVGYKHLIHIIMVTLHGRMSIKQAMDMFKDKKEETLKAISSIDLYSSKDIDELGDNLLLTKLYTAYNAYHNGEPTHYIFGKDLTNSGVGIAGNAFHSEKMMHAGNYSGSEEAHDSHMEFARGFELDHMSRKNIKEIHVGLTHGMSFKSMSMVLSRVIFEDKIDEYVNIHGLEDGPILLQDELSLLDEKFVTKSSIESYGHEVLNLSAIAKWGKDIVNNDRTYATWTIDGYKCASTAYSKKIPLEIYVASNNKSGYSTWSLTSTMPLITDSKGYPIYQATKENPNIENKTNGLYANITHSFDAALLRRVQSYNLSIVEPDGNVVSSLYKHDDYIGSLNNFDGNIEVVQNFMDTEMYQNNPYENVLIQIADNHNIPVEAPQLIIGTAENTIKDSINFLMP